MQLKNILSLIGLLLLFNIPAYSQSDSLVYRILQKTIEKYNTIDTLSYSGTSLFQSLNTEGDWDTVHHQNNRYTIALSKDNQWNIIPSLSRDQSNTHDFYRFRDALIRSKWAVEHHKARLFKTCTKTPYFIIQYYDVPFKLTAAGDSLISQTIYIDTNSYLIRSIHSMTPYNGQLVLASYIIDSINTHEKMEASDIFQLNRGMLKAGTLAPIFSLKNTEEQIINLSDFKGKILLLDFWYAACKPCIKASVKLENLHKKYGKRGLIVLGMNTMDSAPKIKRHNKKHHISYPSLLCDRATKTKYQVRSFPSFYLIDRQGTIVFSSSGYYVGIEKDLELAILQALSNR